MSEKPRPPDRDDPVTERAVSMDRRPAEPGSDTPRAVDDGFSRHPGDRGSTSGAQEEHIQGAGYPTEDRDDVDPEKGSNAPGLDTGDGQLGEMMPERDDVPQNSGDQSGRDDRAPGLETGDGQLDDLLEPPGGDDLGGDRDTDPNLNGGHGLRMTAPEEGDIPIEEEDSEDSIIGHGHEEKAAWNRERVSHLQDMEGGDRRLNPGTSEMIGLGGAALAGAQDGWEGGNASPTLDNDPKFDDELSEEEEVLGDMRLEDASDVMEDESINDTDGTPRLPEDRDLPDADIDVEERLIGTEGEDPIVSGAELGVNEDLEMEDLNETDNIEQAFEDQRDRLDTSMDGNERRGGVEDD